MIKQLRSKKESPAKGAGPVTFKKGSCMDDLISIHNHTIAGEEKQMVNLRDLWKALEVRTRFNDWSKQRLSNPNLLKGRDYKVLLTSSKTPKGGRPPVDYLVLVSVAKELALMERNSPTASSLRQYLITVEERIVQFPTAESLLPL